MSSAEFESGNTQSPEGVMLALETHAFLHAAEEMLQKAQKVAALLAAQRLDIRLVRQDSSRIGRVNCDRLRFTPSQVDQGMRAIVEHTGYHEVRELIVEIPQAYRGETPAFVFTTMKIDKEPDIRHLVSESLVAEIDADANHFDMLLDIDKDDATEEEIVTQLETVTLLNSLINTYQMANQSRADGTAES